MFLQLSKTRSSKFTIGSKHAKVCIKSSPKKILFQKQSLLNIRIQKDIKNLFKLHFEIIEYFIEFIVSCT
jgi:hypothetical protein